MIVSAALLACLLPSPAIAAGYSTDIELLRAGFAEGSVPGVDSPLIVDDRKLRLGLFAQYEENPLILYNLGNEVGPVVRHRGNGLLGVDYTLFSRAAVRLTLPVYTQTGSQVATYAADGTGLGDAAVALRIALIPTRPFSLGLRTDFTFPTGARDNWMGEEGMRTGAAVLSRTEWRRLALLADVGAVFRGKVDTEADFNLGSEVSIETALQAAIWPSRAWVFGGALGRAGFTEVFQGGAENAWEAIAGLQLAPVGDVQVDLGWGKGLTEGYGTTDQRFFAAITYTPVRRPKPEPPAIAEPEIQEVVIPPDPPVEEPPEDEWQPGQLAKVKDKEIMIRDPIQFDFDTERILPISIPTLQAVASLMRTEERLEHVVIEGHASEEGVLVYNYDLSIRRSRAVWEQLVLAGVHPDRISYRGMGVVEPKVVGTDEAALAVNRRVEFHITRTLDPLEPSPKHNPDVKLPWSGASADIKTPPPGQTVNLGLESAPAPIRAEEPDKPKKLEDRLDIRFDDDDDDADPKGSGAEAP